MGEKEQELSQLLERGRPRGRTPSPYVVLIIAAIGAGVVIGTVAILNLVTPFSNRAATSGCVVGDASTSAKISSGYGSVVSNLWNLQSADGGITLCYVPGRGMNSSASLSNVMVQGQPANLVGYPEIGYGDGLEGESFGPQSNAVAFPMSVSSFSQLNPFSNTTFATRSLGAGSIDVGYDLWVKGRVGGATVSTDYEVMILFVFPFNCASYSNATYQYTNTIYVGSQPKSETWTVCVAAGGTHARLVQFVLTGSSQIESGEVALRPMDFIRFVEEKVGGAPLSGYFVEGLEFGTEFWSSSSNQAVFQWSVTRWSVGSGTAAVTIVG